MYKILLQGGDYHGHIISFKVKGWAVDVVQYSGDKAIGTLHYQDTGLKSEEGFQIFSIAL